MIRIFFILGIIVIVIILLGWGYRWLAANRVRITLTRSPTGREILLFSMAIQVLKTLVRIFLRRF